MVSVALSVTEPKLCWEVNVEGTRNALAAAHNAGCKRLVLASSAAVYGNAPGLPKQEDMVATPASPYGYSKWQNEVDAAYYGNYMGLETACMRFFNVFGPRQRPDSPYSGVISIASRQLLNDATFTVFGTGEQTRDFVFVEDVAGAVVTAAMHPGVKADVFNVGRGERVSLLELVEALGKALGKTPKLAYAEPRAGDVLHSLADVTRLNQKLGYVARVPLAQGLAATGAWMREGTQQPVGS
jgi:UDP-glucose 4-epimerase